MTNEELQALIERWKTVAERLKSDDEFLSRFDYGGEFEDLLKNFMAVTKAFAEYRKDVENPPYEVVGPIIVEPKGIADEEWQSSHALVERTIIRPDGIPIRLTFRVFRYSTLSGTRYGLVDQEGDVWLFGRHYPRHEGYPRSIDWMLQNAWYHLPETEDMAWSYVPEDGTRQEEV